MTIATTDHAPTSLGVDHDRHEAIDIRYVLPHMLPEVQQREALDETRIRAYAALYREGYMLGEVMVFQQGQELYVADGFHRIAAAIQAGLDTLAATIRPGTLRDAILYACGCNLHGVPLTQADKRRRVMTMLADPEWHTWSNYAIAKHCGVAESFVRKCRTSLRTERSDVETQRLYRTKHGTVATMDTRAIGQRAAPDTSVDAGTPRVSRPPAVATDTAEVAPGNTRREAISQARQDHTIDRTTPAFAEVIGEAAGRQVALVSPDGSLQDGLMKAAAAVCAASPPRLLQLLEPVAALSTISEREALLLDIPPAWYDRVEQCLDRSVATLNELRSVWQQHRREASAPLQGTQAQTGLVPEVPAEPQRRSQPVPAPRVETEDAPPQPAKTAADYDTTRVYLGKPCRHGHTYGDTGQMLRRKSKGDCVQCHRESKRS